MNERSIYAIDKLDEDKTVYPFATHEERAKWIAQSKATRKPMTVHQLRWGGYEVQEAAQADPKERWIYNYCQRHRISRKLFDELYEAIECNCRSTVCRGYEKVSR